MWPRRRGLSSTRMCILLWIFLGMAVFLFTRINVHEGSRTVKIGGAADVSSSEGPIFYQQVKPKIPRILHQTWITPDIPEAFVKWITTWKTNHPTWDYTFWSDDTMRRLAAVSRPTLLPTYDSYGAGIQRADAGKILMLYVFGGVYADLDMESLRPMDEFLAKHDCFLSQEPMIHSVLLHHLERPLPSNAIMGCRPNHTFFEFVLDSLENVRKGADDPVRTTGPLFLYEVLQKYNQLNISKTNPVYLASEEELMPSFDPIQALLFKGTCENTSFMNDAQRNECEKHIAAKWDNLPSSASYTNHHWSHSWIDELSRELLLRGTPVNIRAIFPNVHMLPDT